MEAVLLELGGGGLACGVMGGRQGGEAYVVSVEARLRDSFLMRKLCARLTSVARLLPNELEFPPGDGSWCRPCRLGKILPKPSLSSQPRYMAVASLPRPKKTKMVKPRAMRIQRSKMTDPCVGISMICPQEGP